MSICGESSLTCKMPGFAAYRDRQQLAFIACIVLILSIILSKFMMTVSMVTLAAIGLVRPDIGDVFKKFWANKAYVAITLVFLVALLSGLYSENIAYLLERLRIKLPFLLLPLAFAGIPAFSQKQYRILLYTLVVLMTLSSLFVLIDLFFYWGMYMDRIGKSGSVPTPIDHIRFSLLVALAVLAGLYLYRNQFYLKYRFEKNILLGCSIFLLLFLHLLAVRSGLLALYAAIFVLIVRYILMTKRYKTGLVMLAFIIALPILAFNFSKSFYTQVHLTKHNFIEFFIKENVGEYSDTQRLASYQMAFKTAGQNNAIIGVGMGDIKDKMSDCYQKYYPEVKPKLPHNQFLFFYVATGLWGLQIFIFAFFFPLWYRQHYKNGFLLAFYVMVFTSFMVEPTLEGAVGTAFYVVFLLIILNSFTNTKTSQGTISIS